MRRSGLLRVAVSCFVGWTALSLAAAEPLSAGPDEYVDDYVETFDIEHYDVDRLRAAADAGRPFVLSYFGSEHTIRVQRNNMRSRRFAVTAVSRDGFRTKIPPRTRTYKGRVVGEPESIVRLTIDDRGLRGFIKSSEGWTFIEPVARDRRPVAKGPGGGVVAHRVFGEQDLAPRDVGSCRIAHPPSDDLNGAEIRGSSAHDPAEHVELDDGAVDPDASAVPPPPAEGADDDPPPALPGAAGTMEIALVADHEFFLTHGANSLTEMESVMNAVEGMFEAEIGLAIEISDVTIWEDAADPYDESDALALLVQLRSYWNSNKDAVPRDVVHLFTGRDLDGSTVGIAYVGVVCRLSNAYSLSQDIVSDYLEGILVAHELGHSLGAGHDAVGSSPRYIMYPSLGGSNLDEFSDSSEATMMAYIGNQSCFSDGSSGGSSGGGSGGGGGRGGGGGGPVDPFVLLLVAGGVGIERLRRRRKAC